MRRNACKFELTENGNDWLFKVAWRVARDTRLSYDDIARATTVIVIDIYNGQKYDDRKMVKTINRVHEIEITDPAAIEIRDTVLDYLYSERL